jgi:hypothetical protein
MRAAVAEAAKVYTVDWERYGFLHGPAFHKCYNRIVLRLQLAVIAAGLSQFITSVISGPDATIALVTVLSAAEALSFGLARNKNALNVEGHAYIDKLRIQHRGKKIKKIFTGEEQLAGAVLGSKTYTGDLHESATLYAQAYQAFLNPVIVPDDYRSGYGEPRSRYR